MRSEKSLETVFSLVVAGAAGLALAVGVLVNGFLWFSKSAEHAAAELYGESPFIRSAEVAGFIRTNAPPGGTVLVLGSEPQIYFLSRCRSATGYIYMYPLMENQPFALKMQEAMAREAEAARPSFVVLVEDKYSWLEQPESDPFIRKWWNNYSVTNYTLVRRVSEELPAEDEDEGGEAKSKRTPPAMLVFKRKAE